MGSQSIKTQIYESILKEILDGTYQVNAVLNEKNLVEKYGVSKTPVREALVQLCGEGILKNIPRFGYQIAPITPEEIVETIEFRQIIEISALELSFYRITPEQIQQLKELNKQAEEITFSRNTRIHWESNMEFHKCLCSFSGNRYLQKSLDDSLRTCIRISNQYFTKLWNESIESDAANHIDLAEAIEQRDLERAKAILKEDVESFRKELF